MSDVEITITSKDGTDSFMIDTTIQNDYELIRIMESVVASGTDIPEPAVEKLAMGDLTKLYLEVAEEVTRYCEGEMQQESTEGSK